LNNDYWTAEIIASLLRNELTAAHAQS